MRKISSLPAIILSAFLLTGVFVACRKTDQKPVDQIIVEKSVSKDFYYISPGTDEIVQAVAQNIYRQNERRSFKEELVKRVGHPNWSHSLIADGPGNTRPANQRRNVMYQNGKRAIVYIPFVKEEERQTKAILRVVIDGADTTFRMFYPQQYKKFGFAPKSDAEWNAQNLFNVFADFDYDIFGTTKYIVKDGRIFGKDQKDLLIVTRKPDNQNKGDIASRMASVTLCNTWTSCVYASENPDDGGSCITITNCTTYWYDDGTGSGGDTGGGSTGGGSGTPGSGEDDWSDDPCNEEPPLAQRIEPTEPTDSGNPCGDEPWDTIDQNFGKLCGTYQWTTIGSSWYTTLFTVGFSLVNTDGMLLNFVFSYPCVQIAKTKASTATLANEAWNEAWNYAADKVLKDANTYGGPLDDFRVKQNMKTYIQTYLNQYYPGSTFNPAGCSGNVPISRAKYCP